MKLRIVQIAANLAGTVLMLGAVAVFGNDGVGVNPPAATRPAGITDKEITDPTAFLMAVNNIELAKIEMGRLPKERAQSKSVRELGARVVRDLNQLESQARTLASSLGFGLPNGVDAVQQGIIDKLASFSGTAFDWHYVEDQIKGHGETISWFQQVAAENTDAGVRDFALNTIPLLRQHLQLFETALKGIKQPAGASTGP